MDARELTRDEKKKIRTLVTGMCANYDRESGLCLPLDCACYMLHKCWTGAYCRYFRVQIVITDDGCGIHPEDIHHIFKRFYRSRFSKDKQGIGLGLPLAKAIIEAHNGTIEVDSELGIGTTFTMNFLIPTKL